MVTAMLRRNLEFTSKSLPAEQVLKKLFAVLAPDRPLPDTPSAAAERSQNWGVDQEYRTAQGDGVRIAEYCYGAVAGEGIDTIYSLRIGSELSVFVTVHDYAQDTLVFELHASPEILDVATDALLQVARATGLKLARRDDAPKQ